MLRPEIHLYQKGSQKDFWPAGHSQQALDIPPGTYEIDLFEPGFDRFRRDVTVVGARTELRVIMLVSMEATGQLNEITGMIISAKDYVGMWVVAFPLAGSPPGSTDAQVGEGGRFKITAPTAGPYLLTLMRGDTTLGCKSVFIGSEHHEVQISACGTSLMTCESLAQQTTLKPNLASVRVIVSDTFGASLTGVRVTLTSVVAGVHVSGVGGEAEVDEVPFGVYDLEARLPGFRPRRERVSIGQPSLTFHLGLELAPTHSDRRPKLSGSVKPYTKGPTLWVRLSAVYGSDLIENTVDSAGRFELDGMGIGKYVLFLFENDKMLAVKPDEVLGGEQKVDLTPDRK